MGQGAAEFGLQPALLNKVNILSDMMVGGVGLNVARMAHLPLSVIEQAGIRAAQMECDTLRRLSRWGICTFFCIAADAIGFGWVLVPQRPQKSRMPGSCVSQQWQAKAEAPTCCLPCFSAGLVSNQQQTTRSQPMTVATMPSYPC